MEFTSAQGPFDKGKEVTPEGVVGLGKEVKDIVASGSEAKDQNGKNKEAQSVGRRNKADEAFGGRYNDGASGSPDEEAPPPQYELEASSPQPSLVTLSYVPQITTTFTSPSSSAMSTLPPRTSSNITPETPSTSTTVNPSDGRTVNFISISKPFGNIYCNYLLDPSLQLPSSFMPKLKAGRTETERPNLSLKTKVGSINADVVLYHRDGANLEKRTLLEFKTTIGAIVVKLDTPTAGPRPSFQVKLTMQSGQTTLYLPRSFNGFLTIISTVSNVTLSPEVAEVNRWISTSGKVKKAFIGDAASLDSAGEMGAWNGDEVIVEGTGVGVEIHWFDGSVRW